MFEILRRTPYGGFTLHEIRKSSTLVEYVRQINFFMQNKPNFTKCPMSITSYISSRYEKIRHFSRGKNEPNTNPIRTQSNPIAKTAKWNLNYWLAMNCVQITINYYLKKQTQFQTQFKPNFRIFLPGPEIVKYLSNFLLHFTTIYVEFILCH